MSPVRSLLFAAAKKRSKAIPLALSNISWHTAVWAGDPAMSLNDGDSIASFHDLSTNNRTIEQATVEARPTFKASDSALNNKPSINLSGTQYIGTATFTSITQPLSLVSIVYIDPTQPLINGTIGGAGANWIRFSPTGTIDIDDAGPAQQIYTTDARGLAFIVVAVWSGASSKYRVNTQVGTKSMGSSTTDRFWIGDEYGDGARVLKGRIAFQGLYAGDLTLDAGYNNFLSWASAEYGIATNSAIPFVAPSVTYDPAITITTGGTYTGLNVAGITVNTTQPVVIEGCNIKASGRHLVVSAVSGVQLTVRNNWLEGSAVRDNAGWRAVRVNNPASIIVENNDFFHTAPILVSANSSVPSIRVRYNRTKDVVGDELNNSGGGYAPCFQFAGASGVLTTPSCEVAWNQTINTPNESNQEDFVNLFAASGSDAAHPIIIHDNFLWGAYPWPISDTYSGGGILTGDGGGGATNNINVYDNQIIGSANYGIQIGGGDNNHFYRNRSISSAQIADGTPVPATNTNPFWTYNTAPTNCSMTDNVLGFMRPPNGYIEPGNATWHRADYWIPAVPGVGNVFSGNTSLTANANDRIYYASEQAEYTSWLAKVAAAGIVIGRTS